MTPKNVRLKSSLVHFAVQDVHLRTKLKGINQTSIKLFIYNFFYSWRSQTYSVLVHILPKFVYKKPDIISNH
jgi:hypothetical protein